MIKEKTEFRKIPVKIEIQGKQAVTEYIRQLYGGEAEIIRPVYKYQLIRYRKKPDEKGQLCYVAGESELQNAEEVYFNSKFEKLLYLCEKSVDNIEKVIAADPDTDYQAMMKEFIEHYCYVMKLRLPLFESFTQKLSAAVQDGKYDLLTIKEKAELINQLLIVSKSGAGRVTLNPKLGIKAEVGRLKDKTIYPEIVDWIDMPLTGLYMHTEKGLK